MKALGRSPTTPNLDVPKATALPSASLLGWTVPASLLLQFLLLLLWVLPSGASIRLTDSAHESLRDTLSTLTWKYTLKNVVSLDLRAKW